ncbi:hypothetical protein EV383_0638 [Pseudonocardia sediminis]|uniref:Uncharacterized protein n=1 Tax=Pseudonocardia sediminis TaxID=1397368 RepID=A0A4Q7UUV9_PSEST|nr:hypothetical protein [Pseudonocardia sediminis]RZT83819.1 hypothetical protein EV383_0638 [Pseudonocardia sediminis]
MNNRVVTAARLNVVDAKVRLGMPWLVVGAAFLINLLIFVLVRSNVGETGPEYTGALAALYISMAAAYIQTMTQTFPFALSLGLTRRHFYLGVSLVVVMESLMHGVLLTVALAIERATGGWGMDLNFFGVPFLVQSNPVLQVVVYTVPLLALGFLGLLAGTVFRRWGQIGVYTAAIGSTLVLGGLAVLITWQQWWGSVGEFFSATPDLALVGVYPLVLVVLAAAGGFLMVRRATP